MTDRTVPTGPMPGNCTRCGFPWKEHTYNGACYGICGQFAASPPAPAAEAVAWQWRFRAPNSDSPAAAQWSSWADGRAPELRASVYETEERPLYTHPLDAATIRAEALEEHIRLLNTEAKRLLDEAEAMPTGFEQDSRGVAMILEARALDEAADALRRLADKGEAE